MSRPNVGDFIFKLNKLEANPLLIIIFLVPDPIQHIEPYSINCTIPSFPQQSVPGYTVLPRKRDTITRYRIQNEQPETGNA